MPWLRQFDVEKQEFFQVEISSEEATKMRFQAHMGYHPVTIWNVKHPKLKTRKSRAS